MPPWSSQLTSMSPSMTRATARSGLVVPMVAQHHLAAVVHSLDTRPSAPAAPRASAHSFPSRSSCDCRSLTMILIRVVVVGYFDERP